MNHFSPVPNVSSGESFSPFKHLFFPNSYAPRSSPPFAGKKGSAQSQKPSVRIIPREYVFMLAALVMMGDWVVSCTAAFAGLQFREWQRFGTLLFDGSLRESYILAWSIGGGTAFVWLMILFKTYQSQNLYRVQLWFKNALKSAVLWAILNWAIIGLFSITEFSPRVGVVYGVIALVSFFVVWRLATFVFLMRPQVKETASSRVIMIGWNDRAAHLRHAMHRDLAQLQMIVGCVPMPNGEFASTPPVDMPVLGNFASLAQLASDHQADAVILSDVSCSADEIRNLITFCQTEMLHFQMVPEYFPALHSGLQVDTLSGVPLLSVHQLPLDRTINGVFKRTMDIVGSLIGLSLSGFLIVPFCIFVYLESPGPVIYRQRRTSRSGRTFYICKIRSMRMNAESNSGAVWCQKEDARRLKIGAFMRKYNIDELPQFWNVLVGDMSLVGPRPERPELIEKFKSTIPNYNARHAIRGGMTGWAQINGLRGDTDLSKRVEADLYYLENWNVLLDFYCLVATFFKVKNAY